MNKNFTIKKTINLHFGYLNGLPDDNANGIIGVKDVLKGIKKVIDRGNQVL